MKRLLKAIFLILIFSFASCETKEDEDLKEIKKETTHFIDIMDWQAISMIEPIVFSHPITDKKIQANLQVTNDSNYLYMLLKVKNETYYLGKNDSGEWADIRIRLIFDEDNDKEFKHLSEDCISILLRDFQIQNTDVMSVPAAQGDGYFDSTSMSWSYEKEVEWEIENISDQRFNGGRYAKEVFFWASDDLINGNNLDFIVEFKIPINSIDPYDLQSQIGDSIGFAILYGNGYDGYATYPEMEISPYYSPDEFYEYHLK